MTQLLDGNFQGLQHLGVPVTDIEVSKTFYARLGFRPVMEKCFADDQGPVSAVMVKRGSMVIELYQQPGERREEVFRRRDGHIDHVAFSVQDIDAAFEELRAAGFEPQQPAPVELPFWEKGCKYFSIRGPGGETLEFNQIL